MRAIALEASGSGYTSPPAVTIKGGGGTGAQATAQVDSNGTVQGFTVTHGGRSYVPPPAITFASASILAVSPSKPKATVIVSNGKVVGVKILDV